MYPLVHLLCPTVPGSRRRPSRLSSFMSSLYLWQTIHPSLNYSSSSPPSPPTHIYHVTIIRISIFRALSTDKVSIPQRTATLTIPRVSLVGEDSLLLYLLFLPHIRCQVTGRVVILNSYGRIISVPHFLQMPILALIGVITQWSSFKWSSSFFFFSFLVLRRTNDHPLDSGLLLLLFVAQGSPVDNCMAGDTQCFPHWGY